MSKIERKIQKNTKKIYNEDKNQNEGKNLIMNFFKIIIVILAIILVFCIIGKIKDKKAEDETKYDDSNITAGQTFTRNDEEYYVLFYDDESILNSINSSTKSKIYKVNLKLSINKGIVSEDSNNAANDASSLRINGPTIIKIKNGENVSYVEGKEKVENILKNI